MYIQRHSDATRGSSYGGARQTTPPLIPTPHLTILPILRSRPVYGVDATLTERLVRARDQTSSVAFFVPFGATYIPNLEFSKSLLAHVMSSLLFVNSFFKP